MIINVMAAIIFVNKPKIIVKTIAPNIKITRYMLSPSSFRFFSFNENMRRFDVIKIENPIIKIIRTYLKPSVCRPKVKLNIETQKIAFAGVANPLK